MRCEEYRSKSEAQKTRKRELCEPIIEVIEAILDDDNDFEHKTTLLAGDWCQYSGIYEFEYGPSNRILGPLLRAPSNVTQNKLETKLQETIELYNLLFSNGFGNDRAAELSLVTLEESTERHKKALYDYRIVIQHSTGKEPT